MANQETGTDPLARIAAALELIARKETGEAADLAFKRGAEAGVNEATRHLTEQYEHTDRGHRACVARTLGLPEGADNSWGEIEHAARNRRESDRQHRDIIARALALPPEVGASPPLDEIARYAERRAEAYRQTRSELEAALAKNQRSLPRLAALENQLEMLCEPENVPGAIEELQNYFRCSRKEARAALRALKPVLAGFVSPAEDT